MDRAGEVTRTLHYPAAWAWAWRVARSDFVMSSLLSMVMQHNMRAMRITAFGGPDVLNLVTLPVPAPRADEVLVQNKAIGVNFVDTQHRAGAPYPVGLPLIPGIEAAGIVAAVGAAVTDLKPGDRAAFAGHMGGVYAEYSTAPASRVVPLPESIDFATAAAVLLQGMTAHALVYSACPLHTGDVVLIHAAGSGVGVYLAQMARQRGATVIGTVSSPVKADLARRCGVDHVIHYREGDFVAETMRLTEGAGVRAVFDAVGRDTFDGNLAVLRAQGHLVMYGLTSGSVPPFDINRLSGLTGSGNRGSLFLTWATLSDYAASRDDLVWRSQDVLSMAADGRLHVPIAHTLPLAEAARAHRMLEGRQVAGKLLLMPSG